MTTRDRKQLEHLMTEYGVKQITEVLAELCATQASYHENTRYPHIAKNWQRLSHFLNSLKFPSSK